MSGETTITVDGNLTADPEIRFTATGVPVAAFTVASTPRTYDKDTGQWQDGSTLFLRCSAWRALGEHAAESLRKGSGVIVTGRLRQRSYTTDQGDNRTVYELDADNIGASLKFATVAIKKAARDSVPHPADRDSQATAPATADPWSPGAGNNPGKPPF